MPIYTPEAAGRHAVIMLVLLIAYVLLCLAASRPANTEFDRRWIRADTLLERERMAAGTADPAVKAQKRRRAVFLTIVCAILAAVCSPALVFLLDRRKFVSTDLEAVMGKLLAYALPCAAAALIVLFLGSMYSEKRREKDRAELKERRGLAKLPRVPLKAPNEARARWIVRALLLAAAVIFIILGVMNGGLNDVLIKAINICTECIGLG